MQPMESIHVSLPRNIVASMNEAVGMGVYSTRSEIVQEALTQWQQRREWTIGEIRRLWDEGLASGIAPDDGIEDIIAEARQEFAKDSTV